ncbi:MAG TPA: 1-deoxy-D-xylulose-5-phosphate synthase [bacterium (Candidatus Stahlbacteria)]|nr:1-deoxy-D-xylulose-5-phosphate synthase [Candidatus Stahlbacteria bacterium]
MKLLDQINSPKDLKSFDIVQLKVLAQEIRDEIIETVARNGGHLAPNLGVVELTLALHYVFDAPKDKIIWDVGHQSYTHKLITGRRAQFHTLRKYGGIGGFPRIDESEYDCFGTGHASTSISAALGMVIARDLAGEDYKVVAVIGDGALSAGMAYEGLNQASFLKKDLIVVLNDNRMSIAKNVGGMASYLSKIATTPVYHRLKKDVWELLGRLPDGMSDRARELVRKLKTGLKNLVVPTVLFEELGYEYIGPIDGHDLKILIDTFKAVKTMGGSIFVHVITQKGKGYLPASQNPSLFHQPGSFDKLTGKLVKTRKIPSYSEVFGKTLVSLAKKDKRIVAITAAMPDGTGLTHFRDAIPERFFDVGIAEQHAVTFAAGMALKGLRPICAIYSTFLQRGFDQLLHDVCLQNIPVIFCLDRSGVVGEDGPTHHGTFDLSYLRSMPNMVICAPKDEDELRSLLRTAIDYTKGPVAIRYPRGSGVGVPINGRPKKIKIGKAEVLESGDDGTIFAIGSMVYPSLEVSSILKAEGINFGVINARFVKPLDEQLLKQITNKPIVTVEENVLTGGFGSGVLEFLSSIGVSTPTLRIGLPDKFIEHGPRNFLLNKYGLTPKSMAAKIKKFLTSHYLCTKLYKT